MEKIQEEGIKKKRGLKNFYLFLTISFRTFGIKLRKRWMVMVEEGKEGDRYKLVHGISPPLNSPGRRPAPDSLLKPFAADPPKISTVFPTFCRFASSSTVQRREFFPSFIIQLLATHTYFRINDYLT